MTRVRERAGRRRVTPVSRKCETSIHGQTTFPPLASPPTTTFFPSRSRLVLLALVNKYFLMPPSNDIFFFHYYYINHFLCVCDNYFITPDTRPLQLIKLNHRFTLVQSCRKWSHLICPRRFLETSLGVTAFT